MRMRRLGDLDVCEELVIGFLGYSPLGRSLPAGALAWFFSRRPLAIPAPGTKHVRYRDGNATTADLELSPDENARLDALGVAAGERYAASMLPTWVSPPLVS